MWAQIEKQNLLTFDPKEYFKDEYDFWKETTYISSDLDYDDVTDKLDTTNNENKTYDVKLIKIVDVNTKLFQNETIEDKQKHRYFFVAEEKYSNEEIVKLRPYCRCHVCTASIFSLEKYLTCRCCVGCLYTSDHRIAHYVVRNTRKYYEQKQLPVLTRFSLLFSSTEKDK